jgi:DNA-binding CsgD family transcriptional regulator
MPNAADQRRTDNVIRACYTAGDDFDLFRARFMDVLRRAVPHDAAFVAAADPETLLFTNAFSDDALAPSGPLFLASEFGAEHDVNRFADLARSADPVASLDQLTRGDRAASARFREAIAPLGMGDELRVAFRVDRTVWGFLCLHRSGASSFGPDDMAVLRSVAVHAGEAVRRLATSSSASAVAPEAVILVSGRTVTAIGGSADDLDLGRINVGHPLPVLLAALVARLEAIEAGAVDAGASPAAIRVTTPNGALVAVHAARLQEAGGAGPVVLTIASAAPHERSSLLLAAHGLTPAQCRVARLVLQGRTTGQIVVELRISAHTVQDHLKAIFDKFGVRSRRELVGAVMQLH